MSSVIPYKLNRFLFKVAAGIIILMVQDITTMAQEKTGLNKLIPHHIKIQFAGGIGFISAGAGYHNKKGKLEADLFYGYLPKSIGGISLHSLAAKFSWTPLTISIQEKLEIRPLVTGLLIHYNFGKQFFSFDGPENSFKFYGIPSALSAAAFAGSRFSLNRFPAISFYYEIVSFDKEIAAFASNPKSLAIADILSLSFGLRLELQ